MFLNELNKEESIAFVNLVKLLAKVDNAFSEKETTLVNEYIDELSLTNELVEELNFEAAINELLPSTNKVKNIIYFELVGLALSDGVYEEKEIEFLNKVASDFNINKEKQQAYVNYFKNVKDIFDITFIEYESKLKSLKEKALELLA